MLDNLHDILSIHLDLDDSMDVDFVLNLEDVADMYYVLSDKDLAMAVD